SPPTCPADTDGKFAATSMFVSGPRARRMPVLTTAARAQVFSSNTGPWDISAVGANLVLKLDDGENLLTEAAGGTTVSGTVTVAVTAATAANLTAATPAELATWLNGNAGFAARAIAYVEGGKLGLRSRNLGQVHAIQLQTSIVDTQVFAGDILPHTPTGSTPSNKLGQQSTPSANDPKAAWLADGSAITYQLDPVTDLAPGTYVVDIEFGRLGRISATNYKLPTVGRVTFQVKQATEELPVARNCNSCHQSPDNRGMVFDPSRHNKIFNDTAVDQCGSCHDYQPQLVPGMTGYVAGNWSGAVPIAKRVHAVHNGINLTYPVATVGHSDEIPGRDWAIEFPQNIRNCEACHPDGTTSGTWATEAARLPCSGCHDSDEATAHIRIMTYDPTPADPWSGDEQQSCKACH
ncbi:MAG TPA: hypothetical protein VL172_09270, partial [Kofleriaceae bacterium]|nr:hypothetical protein [Kofleriaceae bacterium]